MEAVTSLTKELLNGLTMEPILLLFEKRDMHIAVAKESMERINKEGIEQLKNKVDTLIVIPNQRLLDVIDRKMTLLEAFRVVDSVLSQGVQGISDIITVPGLINVDFADVKAILKDSGSALMGIGRGTGENRATEAAKAAIASPLLEVSIDGAKGILFSVSGGKDLGMFEIEEAARIITEHADPNAKVIFGAVIDEEAPKDELVITVVATGFDLSKPEPAPQRDRTRVGVPSTSRPTPSFSRPQPPQAPQQPAQAPRPQQEDLEIPAFIRRKMKT
jgi:cell division protein FtsZ